MTIKFTARTLTYAWFALLAGCAPISNLLQGGENEQLGELLHWSQRVARAPADVQRGELKSALQAFSADQGLLPRLRLASLFAQPGNAAADDGRAAALLEPFASAGEDAGPLRQFGRLLHAQVSERVKEQRRAQQAREQIEALRALERNLRERTQGAPR